MSCHFCHLILILQISQKVGGNLWLFWLLVNLQLIPTDVAKTIMLAEKRVQRKIGGNNDNLILHFNFNTRLKNYGGIIPISNHELRRYSYYVVSIIISFKIIKKFTFGILPCMLL